MRPKLSGTHTKQIALWRTVGLSQPWKQGWHIGYQYRYRYRYFSDIGQYRYRLSISIIEMKYRKNPNCIEIFFSKSACKDAKKASSPTLSWATKALTTYYTILFIAHDAYPRSHCIVITILLAIIRGRRGGIRGHRPSPPPLSTGIMDFEISRELSSFDHRGTEFSNFPSKLTTKSEKMTARRV